MKTRFRGTVIVLALLCPAAGRAQEAASWPRADGHQTPLRIYRPSGQKGQGAGCAPLAVISHGAGGSEEGYRYLASALARQGYVAVVMGHRESGMEAIRSSFRTHGLGQGVAALVADPQAETARLLDTGAALAWYDGQCKAPFRVLLGHSMGAQTVMLEAGARNKIGIASPPAGQHRFDAYVALSPEGPGLVFPDRAWTDIRFPVLVLTGTRDDTVRGGGGPEARQIPWQQMPGAPGGCQWLGVIDGASHMNFAGVGIGAGKVEDLVVAVVQQFLAGARSGRCTLPSGLNGIRLQQK
jgi:predicted dienelactone hydrolase